jgi:hypothetical protein
MTPVTLLLDDDIHAALVAMAEARGTTPVVEVEAAIRGRLAGHTLGQSIAGSLQAFADGLRKKLEPEPPPDNVRPLRKPK